MTRIVVIGGGITGATAALQLAEAGHDIVLFEAGSRLGGLVVSFEVGGTPLECFYHHVFPHETHIRNLISNLGLSSKLAWLPSSMGVLSHGRIWPFTTPLDILRFGPLTVPERLRLGIGGLRLQRWKGWENLDAVTARDWLRRTCGEAAVDEIWAPLLHAKFGLAADRVPAAWMWGRFQQRRGARRRQGEVLGYLRGGFRQLFDTIATRIEAAGVEIRTSSRVAGVAIDGDRTVGVSATSGDVEADAVLYAGALPGILGVVSERFQESRWRTAEGMGVLCAVLEADRPTTDVYWTNVCDESVGFGALIEHTNLVPATDYGGRHVTYLGRYFTANEEIATADPDAQTRNWLVDLESAIPRFDRSSLLDVHTFRAPYAAPLVSLGYRDQVPPIRAELRGLYLATTAQIYPADRGMSEGVRLGHDAAAAIHADHAPS